MMFGRTPSAEREALRNRLTQLRRDAICARDMEAARTYDDFLLYATVGRDRKKLGMEWADRAEKMVREQAEMFKTFASAEDR
jgi:hypothetical protein